MARFLWRYSKIGLHLCRRAASHSHVCEDRAATHKHHEKRQQGFDDHCELMLAARWE